MQPVLDRALAETRLFTEAGVDALIIENTHDAPYLNRSPEAGTVAAMARVAAAVRGAWDRPLGIQILAGANRAALETAVACGLDFIRVEGFAYAHVADEGWIEADAGELIRRRAHLRADPVEIWADVKKKHGSHAVTGDLDTRTLADGAVFCGADGVVVTGAHTGLATDPGELESLAGLDARRVVGSGVTCDNVGIYAPRADVLIVGSDFKEAGDWRNPVDPDRLRAVVDAFRAVVS